MVYTTLAELLTGFGTVVDFVVMDLFIENVIQKLFLNPDMLPVVVLSLGIGVGVMVLKMFSPRRII